MADAADGRGLDKPTRWLGFKRLRMFLRMGNRNLERLKSDIGVLEIEVAAGYPEGDRETANAYLAKAAAAADTLDLEAGWKAVNAARRLGFNTMTDDKDRAHAAAAIRAEIESKVREGSWRAKAIQETLTCGGTAQGNVVPSSRALIEAQLILDEHAANVYRRLDVFAVLMGWVMAAMVVVLVVLVTGIELGWFAPLEHPFDDPASTLGVIVLGALGALVSTATSTIAGEGRRLPEMVTGWVSALLRPVLGGASAVIVVLALVSGLQDTVSTQGARVWIFAVAAGFSERLLDRLIASADKAAKL